MLPAPSHTPPSPRSIFTTCAKQFGFLKIKLTLSLVIVSVLTGYFSENRTSDRDFLGPWVNQGNRKIMRTSWNWLKICDEKREEEIGVRVAYLWFQHLLFLLCTFLYPPTPLYDFDIF